MIDLESDHAVEDQLYLYATDLGQLFDKYERLAQEHAVLESRYKQAFVSFDDEKSEAARALRDAIIQAESAKLARRMFIANMNHELRTPLNAILGFSHIASRHTLEAETKRALDQISKAGTRLLSLVSEILDAASIDAGHLQIEHVEFSPGKLAEHLKDRLLFDAQAKGLDISLDVDPGLPEFVIGDPIRLGQILKNLVSNAVKFSAQGEVVLRVKQVGRTSVHADLLFEIEDHGIGIANADQDHIFELFEQADMSSTRKIGGTGVGLATSKLLAQLMKGQLGFNSQPGDGSLFWLSIQLPLAKRQLARSADGSPDREISEATISFLRQLLDTGDFQARLLWEESGGSLCHVFGDKARAMTEAIESFNFSTALEILNDCCPVGAGEDS